MDAKEQLKLLVDATLNDNDDAFKTIAHNVIVDRVRNLLGEKKDPEAKAEKIEDKAIKDLQKAQRIEKAHEKKD